jgi:hypothetical protein
MCILALGWGDVVQECGMKRNDGYGVLWASCIIGYTGAVHIDNSCNCICITHFYSPLILTAFILDTLYVISVTY